MALGHSDLLEERPSSSLLLALPVRSLGGLIYNRCVIVPAWTVEPLIALDREWAPQELPYWWTPGRNEDDTEGRSLGLTLHGGTAQWWLHSIA